jgi:hypothetical protein
MANGALFPPWRGAYAAVRVPGAAVAADARGYLQLDITRDNHA